MIGLNSPEFTRAVTSQWDGERGPDGRPVVPGSILERMKQVTIEEAWGVIGGKGYNYQFAGDWQILHPDRTLGRPRGDRRLRAHPARPGNGRSGRRPRRTAVIGGQNSWVIDTLEPDDVIVIDLFGKVKFGTFAGDNLGNSIYAKTGTGMVIDGGIRDLQRLYEIPMMSYIRGVDPTAIADVTLLGINVPVRIGLEATCVPGDIVLGTREGVIFIPPHLAEQVVIESEETRMRDAWGHQQLREGNYTPGEIDREWTPEMTAEFEVWRQRQAAENG